MIKPHIAIITITDGCNYGNRLQNYALQKALEKSGAQVETIRRKNYHDDIGRKIKITCKALIKKILRKDTDAAKRKRKYNFRKFNSKYMRFSRYILQKNKAPKNLADKYDAFVIGSDQVWNPLFRLVQEDIDNYFASFAPKEKKFSYAASFGVSQIPTQYTAYYREKLNTFCRLSVREDQGVDIIRNLCGLNAKSVCDPTLLLSIEEWDIIVEKPQWIDQNRYIVVYFLGEIPDETHQSIDEFAKIKGYNIITLQSEFINSKDIIDQDSFATSPQQFIWLIANAECILTDSFHACVFSILYNRPFQVFSRKAFEENNKMGSRIESLLAKFGMQNRMTEKELNEKVLTKPLDKENNDRVLYMEREKGYSFLYECFKLLRVTN